MALPGETVGASVYHCEGAPVGDYDYHEPHTIEIGVCESGAGYYIGFWCEWFGPISRESFEYFGTRLAAQAALDSDEWIRR